jgi:peptide/nickel transport system ATP-binding protein
MKPVLAAEHLAIDAMSPAPPRRIVRDLSLEVGAGEIVGLVGESGSGKSVTALTALGLAPRGIRIAAGRLDLFGLDVREHAPGGLARLRGRRASVVFQEPMNALNPAMRIERQLTGVIRRHVGLGGNAARRRAAELLEQMLVGEPDRILRSFPHQLSGGLRQRVLLAMALAADVELLVADEPTTALDVTVQAQVLRLIRERAVARGLGVLFITHDLGVVRQLCDRVYVLYAGAVAEAGPTAQVLSAPLHPYTRALRDALPGAGPPKSRLAAISGEVARPGEALGGCPFAARCAEAAPQCTQLAPRLAEGREHGSSCWRRPRP